MTTAQGGQLKKTVTHTAIYSFGTILRRIAGLVMLPIYTRYLTPADYGVVELLSLAIDLMAIFIGLRISSAVFRYYILAENDREKHQVVSTILLTVLFITSIGIACLYYNADWITLALFGNSDYLLEFQLFIYTLMTNAVVDVCLSYIRARQKPILFVMIGIFILSMQIALNIWFVVHLELHVLGVVYSALISSGVVAAGLSLYVFANVGFSFSKALLIRLLKFVSPLVLAAFGGFYVSYADKYFLRIFHNLDAVGLYALAAKVSGILATMFEAFNMSWAADRFEIYKHRNNARVIYDQVFRGVGAILILTGTGLSMFATDLFRIMTQPDFYSASYIVPLLVGVALVRCAFMFCSFGVTLKEKTRHVAEASWMKAVVATAGYLLLIPPFGVYGAAFTLMVATLVQHLWVNAKSKNYYDMALNWRPIYVMLFIATIVISVSMLLPEGDLFYFAVRVLLYLAVVVSFYLLPLWSMGERKVMVHMASKILQKRFTFFGRAGQSHR